MAMRKTVLIAVMLLTTAFAIAQQLERCTLDGFSQTVKNVLIPGYDKACGMVSSPSFDYLSSIMLYPEKRELVYRKAKDNFTGQLAEDQIPVETSTMVITDKQNSALTALFDALIASSREKEEPKPGEFVSVGLDGETYHFFKDGKAGKCWSPGEGDNRAKLVFLFREISRYVRNHRPLSDELIEQVQDLAKQFSM